MERMEKDSERYVSVKTKRHGFVFLGNREHEREHLLTCS
jgi:hypothetical protein